MKKKLQAPKLVRVASITTLVLSGSRGNMGDSEGGHKRPPPTFGA